MGMLSSLPLYLSAGIINGSFATPTKHIKKWSFENIWFQHAMWSFLILPWVTIFFFAPQVIKIYSVVSFKMLAIAMIGGFVFGIGQVASAFAIYTIGIGLAFVICIGISTGLGFLLPLIIQHPEKIMTPFGYVTLIGTLLAIFGFIFSTYAGKLRSQHQGLVTQTVVKASPRNYLIGVILALVAGIFSAGQNLAFSLTSSMQQTALDMGATKFGAAMIMWPWFLTFAFIPYATYMIYLFYKNDSFSNYRTNGFIQYYSLTFFMGIMWYSSLLFYSKASQMSGPLGPIFGWPLFMVLIILTSNCWGWVHHEWKNAGYYALKNLFIGLGLLVGSMLVLGFSFYLSAS